MPDENYNFLPKRVCQTPKIMTNLYYYRFRCSCICSSRFCIPCSTSKKSQRTSKNHSTIASKPVNTKIGTNFKPQQHSSKLYCSGQALLCLSGQVLTETVLCQRNKYFSPCILYIYMYSLHVEQCSCNSDLINGNSYNCKRKLQSGNAGVRMK